MSTSHKLTGRVHRISVMFLFFIFSISSVALADQVDTGYQEFDTVDGGGTECRLKDFWVWCGIEVIPDFLGINPWKSTLPVPGLVTPLESFPYWAIRTVALPESKIVGSVFTNVAHLNPEAYLQAGIPHYASSQIYKDITIADPAGNGGVVEVQITANFDWEGGILGYLNYDASFSIGVDVEDISGSILGSATFVEKNRTGDQGVTDIAFGASGYDGNGDTGHFIIKLERGQTYRIYFKTEAYGAPLVSAITSEVRARLNYIGVLMEPDDQQEVLEALALHDLEIKDQLVLHDSEIKSQVDQHDLDIKARLDEIEAKLDILTERQLEVIRLLHTAEGQRESEVPACDGAPCKWPNKAGK